MAFNSCPCHFIAIDGNYLVFIAIHGNRITVQLPSIQLVVIQWSCEDCVLKKSCADTWTIIVYGFILQMPQGIWMWRRFEHRRLWVSPAGKSFRFVSSVRASNSFHFWAGSSPSILSSFSWAYRIWTWGISVFCFVCICLVCFNVFVIYPFLVFCICWIFWQLIASIC